MPASAREPSLHRKNAAEWMMWACLLPLVAIVRLFELVRHGDNGHG